MSDFGRRPVPGWYWLASAIALLWCIIGCSIYIYHMTASPETIASWPVSQQKMWALEPAWHKGVFAIAVWSALIGGIGLVLRKRWAVAAFLVSLVAVIVQFGYSFFGMPIFDIMTPAEALPMPVFILLAGLGLLWLARKAQANGLLT